jgi:hypothetical protein
MSARGKTLRAQMARALADMHDLRRSLEADGEGSRPVRAALLQAEAALAERLAQLVKQESDAASRGGQQP